MFFKIEKLPFYNPSRFFGFKKLKIYVDGKNITKHINKKKEYDFIIIKEKFFKKNIENLLEDLKNQYLKIKNNYSNIQNLKYNFSLNNDGEKNKDFFSKLTFNVYFENSQDKTRELIVQSMFLNFNSNKNEKKQFVEKCAFQKNYFIDYVNYLEKSLKEQF